MKIRKKHLLIAGWSITFIGLAIGLSELLGCFKSQEKENLYSLIRYSNDPIPLDHPALKDFMKDFPPPANYQNPSIRRFKLQTAGDFALQGTVQYVNGSEFHDAASFEDVRLWAEKTISGWIAWVVILTGFLIQMATDLFELKSNEE